MSLPPSSPHVADDGPAAAESGQRTIAPGGAAARAASAPHRCAPAPLALKLTKRLMPVPS